LALVNAPEVLKTIAPHASRVLVLHGHRHIDWIGTYGDVVPCSASSTTLSDAAEHRRSFHIHDVALCALYYFGSILVRSGPAPRSEAAPTEDLGATFAQIIDTIHQVFSAIANILSVTANTLHGLAIPAVNCVAEIFPAGGSQK
jgi:hypothetical protein